MKLRVVLFTLFIGAVFATFILALFGLGVHELSSILLCLYIAGAVIALIVAIRLSDKEKVREPWMVWIFVSNELMLLLFVALWPVLAPLAIAEIILRGRSNRRKDTVSDVPKRNS